MYWSVALLLCFGCHCCSSGTVAQPQRATSPSSATATSPSSGPAPTTAATTPSQPQPPTSAPPTQNTTGTPTATTQTTPLTALTTTVKPTSAPTGSNSGTGGTKSSTASTGNANGTISKTTVTTASSSSISATPVSNGGNPTTPAPTGSSSKPSGSSLSASSSTVKLDQCYKHTCNDTAKGCMAENLNTTIGVDKCLRNDKYCKITLTIKDKVYSIEADCVDGPCEYDDITDNAGQRISNCCKENLCNDESILKGSAHRAWHGYFPCLVAVISAAYYFA